MMFNTPFDLRNLLNFLLAHRDGALSVTIFKGAGIVANNPLSF